MTDISGKRLFYFTASFPWGVGQTWKSNELTYLREYFDQVTVVPLAYDDNFDSPKVLPKGVTAERPLFRNGVPELEWRSAVELLDRYADGYVLELLRKPTALNRSRLGAWFGASLQMHRLAVHPVVRQIIDRADSDTSMCFFWGRGAADIVPLVDTRRFRSVIVRFHRFDLFEEETGGYMPYRRQLLQKLSLAAPSSEKGRQHLQARYPDVSTPIEVVRLGVPRLPELARSSDGVLRILSCSYVVPRKRVGLIADALHEVRFPVHWTHVGDGPEMNAIRQKIATLPPNVQTHFPGAIATDRLFEFYQQRPIDIFVNVSTSEGVAMTILECLSAGVPVFATDVGGSGEVVDESVGALLPADVTPARLAAELERFHSLSPAERQRHRDAAIHRHRELGDVEALTRRLAQLLLQPSR